MSPSSSNETTVKTKRWDWRFAAILPLWVFAVFILVQLILGLILTLALQLGVSEESLSGPLFNTVATAVIYMATLILAIGVPMWTKKQRVTLTEIGLHRLPNWADLGMAPIGFIAYFILSGIFIALTPSLLPFVDLNQVQDTGFSGLTGRPEYILAFLSLVVIAPIAEEIIFRGYLLGKLRKYTPLWVSILITSLLFALVHFAWNVGIDVFALSIVLCLLRVWSKSLWPSILLHMLKNFVAFYLLFINPSFLTTLGG